MNIILLNLIRSNEVSSLYKEHYIIKFDDYLEKDFDVDFDYLARRLQLLLGNPRRRLASRFKEWVIILFVTLGLNIVWKLNFLYLHYVFMHIFLILIYLLPQQGRT